MIVQVYFRMEEEFPLVLRVVPDLQLSQPEMHKGVWQGLSAQGCGCKAVTPLLPGFLFHWAIAAGSGWLSRYFHEGVEVMVHVQDETLRAH